MQEDDARADELPSEMRIPQTNRTDHTADVFISVPSPYTMPRAMSTLRSFEQSLRSKPGPFSSEREGPTVGIFHTATPFAWSKHPSYLQSASCLQGCGITFAATFLATLETLCSVNHKMTANTTRGAAKKCQMSLTARFCPPTFDSSLGAKPCRQALGGTYFPDLLQHPSTAFGHILKTICNETVVRLEMEHIEDPLVVGASAAEGSPLAPVHDNAEIGRALRCQVRLISSLFHRRRGFGNAMVSRSASK